MSTLDLTFTLSDIRKHRPCEDGWKKLLRGLGYRNGDYDPEHRVSLADVAIINGVLDAMWCLRCLEWGDMSLRRAVIDTVILPAAKRASVHTSDKRVHAHIAVLEKWVAGNDTIDLRANAATAAARAAANAAWAAAATADAAWAAWAAARAAADAAWAAWAAAATANAAWTAAATANAAWAAAATADAAWAAARAAAADRRRRRRRRPCHRLCHRLCRRKRAPKTRHHKIMLLGHACPVASHAYHAHRL